MYRQCQYSGLPIPKWATEWVNICKEYKNFYGFIRASLKLMLVSFEMKFEGRPHSGLDDTRNIARVALRMLKDGNPLVINERLDH